MQIVLFLPHYQLVYANFDFSSFSLISYVVIYLKLLRDMRHFILSFITIGLMVCVKMQYHHIGTTRRKCGVNGVETML